MRAALTEGQFPILARLSSEVRRELVALSPFEATPKQQLLQRGQPARGAYFVVRGSLRVYYISPEGRVSTLYRVEPGGTCILAMTSTFTEAPYPAWVDASSSGASFVRVPTEVFRRLFDREPAFREYVFGVLSGRVFELMRTLEEAGSARVEQRVARYILRNADASGGMRTTQAGIASDLGTAREVVFRALRSLASQNLVETGRMKLRVLDRARLERAAGDS
ncbi:MAG: Crp/Fnr family transcriptional regulator [Polyangiaceae bacterium]